MLLARDANCLDGDTPDGAGFDVDSFVGTFIGVPNLYFEPVTVFTIFFSTASLASVNGLVTIASPSGIER